MLLLGLLQANKKVSANEPSRRSDATILINRSQPQQTIRTVFHKTSRPPFKLHPRNQIHIAAATRHSRLLPRESSPCSRSFAIRASDKHTHQQHRWTRNKTFFHRLKFLPAFPFARSAPFKHHFSIAPPLHSAFTSTNQAHQFLSSATLQTKGYHRPHQAGPPPQKFRHAVQVS